MPNKPVPRHLVLWLSPMSGYLTVTNKARLGP